MNEVILWNRLSNRVLSLVGLMCWLYVLPCHGAQDSNAGDVSKGDAPPPLLSEVYEQITTRDDGMSKNKKVEKIGYNDPFWNTVANVCHLHIGVIGFLGWCLLGLILCLTIVGIPLGRQAFKMAFLVLWPFGKKVVYQDVDEVGNWLHPYWLMCAGILGAFFHLFLIVLDVIFSIAFFFACITEFSIQGLLLLVSSLLSAPTSFQHWKLAKLALSPFGAEVI